MGFLKWLVAVIDNHTFLPQGCLCCVDLQMSDQKHCACTHTCTCRFICLYSFTSLFADILTYLLTHALHHLSCLFAPLLTHLLTHFCILHILDLFNTYLLACLITHLIRCLLNVPYIFACLFACLLACLPTSLTLLTCFSASPSPPSSSPSPSSSTQRLQMHM